MECQLQFNRDTAAALAAGRHTGGTNVKKIALLGHGVVGSGVVEVLERNRESIQRKAQDEISLAYILDLRDFPELPYAGCFVKSFEPILADPEVSVVVEAMGGLHPAYDFTKAALQAGKSVVTSNKELVAERGDELLAIAAQKNVNFLFEASVGGGIPIIKPLHQCLGANEIYEIAGILNGTTNFILTKMIKEGASFEAALQTAQQLGYAERDPSADVQGTDACRKICILADIAFGKHIPPEEVYTQGITQITPEDVQYASNWGGVIKLIGRTYKTSDGKVLATVYPAFVPHTSQLSGVDDVFNGILVRGDATGDVVFYGKGAGKLPTASAVVSDIIDAVRATGTIRTLHWQPGGSEVLADLRKQPVQAYLRLSGPNARQVATALLGELQPLSRPGSLAEEFACITPTLPEEALQKAVENLEQQGVATLGLLRLLDI